jgi:predicted hydrolase (HD superfamily)
VIKRMKDKAFARAVNRDDLRRGAEELGHSSRSAHHRT